MARKKPAASAAGIPMWFLTYSDVVTLLMTFFILLLTFATDEPELFQQMKTSMFGGHGGQGVAGDNFDALDRESLVVRMRPSSGRMTTRGSESPAMHSDPVVEALGRGLKALTESSDLASFERMSFETSVDSFYHNGKLTSAGEAHLRLLALQMQRMPLDLKLEVGRPEDLEAIIEMCDILTNDVRIPTGRVSASIADGDRAPRHGLRMTVVRTR